MVYTLKTVLLTNKQIQIAQRIDNWVKTIERQGGGETELLEKGLVQMATVKELLDTSTHEQFDSLCGTYPGFYHFAKLLEKIAKGICDGTISVPPAN